MATENPEIIDGFASHMQIYRGSSFNMFEYRRVIIDSRYMEVS